MAAGGDIAGDPDAPGFDVEWPAIVLRAPPPLWARGGYPDPPIIFRRSIRLSEDDARLCPVALWFGMIDALCSLR